MSHDESEKERADQRPAFLLLGRVARAIHETHSVSCLTPGTEVRAPRILGELSTMKGYWLREGRAGRFGVSRRDGPEKQRLEHIERDKGRARCVRTTPCRPTEISQAQLRRKGRARGRVSSVL